MNLKYIDLAFLCLFTSIVFNTDGAVDSKPYGQKEKAIGKVY